MKAEQLDFNRELYSFKDALYNFAISFTRNEEDAADLVQDTMLKAIRYAQRFEEGTNLKCWLYMILKNTFINNYRKKNRFRAYRTESLGLAMNDARHNLSFNVGEAKCAVDDIHKALNRLPKDCYYPFIKYFEGYKYHEIAAELDVPIGTVKTRIHMARLALKKNLKMYRKELTHE